MTDSERLIKLEIPQKPVDCVLDTDTYNEIDDQFALSFLVKHEKTRVKALYACPFHNANSSSPEDGMEKSYDEILNLVDLIGDEAKDIPVFKGSRTYLPDEKTFIDCPAARHLCELASAYSPEKPLYVVSIGCITNIASALLMKPEIVENIVVVWLGGHAPWWKNTREFNMLQDVAAARVVFNSGCPLVQLPCMGVVSSFYVTGLELDYYLAGKNPLCDYLVKHTKEACARDTVWSKVIWDVTAAAWLVNENDRFMLSEIVHTPVPEYDDRYAYDNTRPLMRRVTHIQRDALMEELFRVLTK